MKQFIIAVILIVCTSHSTAQRAVWSIPTMLLQKGWPSRVLPEKAAFISSKGAVDTMYPPPPHPAATRTWNGAGVIGGTGGTDVSNGANYLPTGSLISSDDLSFNLGSVANTSLVQLSSMTVNSITVNFAGIGTTTVINLITFWSLTAPTGIWVYNTSSTSADHEIDVVFSGSVTTGSFTSIGSGTGGSSGFPYLYVGINSGVTLTCNGAWSSTSNSTSSWTTTAIANSGTIQINGSTTLNSNGFQPTLMLVGNGANTIFNGSLNYGAGVYNVLASSRYTLLGGTVSGSTGTFTCKSDVTFGPTSGTNTLFNTAGTILFDGTGTQSVTDNSYAYYNNPANVTIGSSNNPTVNFVLGTATSPSGPLAPSVSFSVNGSSTCKLGVGEIMNSYSYRSASTSSGTASINSTATLVLSGTTGGQTGSNFPIGYSSATVSTTSVVEYDGTAAQTVFSFAYGNFTCTNAGVKTLGGAITCAGTVKLNAGTTLDVSTSNYSISFKGDWNNAANATFVARNGTVTMNGTGTETVYGSTSFYNLTLSNTSGTSNWGSSIITVGNNLFNSAGTMSQGTSKFIFTGVAGSIAGNNAKNFYDLQINAGAAISHTVGGASGRIHITNSYVNNGSITQVSTQTIFFDGAGVTETMSGSGTSIFGSFVIGSSSFSTSATTVTSTHSFTVGGSSWTFNAKNSSFVASSGTVSFASATCAIGNASGITGTSISYYGMSVSNTTTMNMSLTVSNLLTINNGNIVSIGSNTITLTGAITGAGSLSGITSSNLTMSGTGQVGTLRFVSGGQTLNTLSLNRTGISSNYAALLGSSLTVNALTLTSGILATDNNLLTWTKTGSLLPSAQTSYTANTTSYKTSYICICDGTGTGLSITEPFDGTKGFRINSVGTDVWFPVGVDFTAPNRMWLNNTGTSDNITVAIKKGDIYNTDFPVVRRIWYVNEGTTGGTTADMRLYFTKQDNTAFGVSQDEVENGFDYSATRLAQRNYGDDNYLDISQGADVQNLLSNTLGTEVYGNYSIGVSQDIANNTDGINYFSRFMVLNDDAFILPVTVTNFRVLQNGDKAMLSWISNTEINIESYVIERSADNRSYTSVGSVKALNSGALSIPYSFTDVMPLTGKNYYRVKVVEKDGRSYYTNIQALDFTRSASVVVYPNPVKSILTVSISEPTLLRLYDSQGRLVMQKNGTELDCSLLPNGVYFLKVNDQQVKIIVEH